MEEKSQNGTIKKYVISIIAAVFIAFSFLADFSEIYPESTPVFTESAQVIEKISKRFLATFEGREIVISLAIIIISFIFIKFYDKICSLKHVKFEHIAAIILAFLFIAGRFFLNDYPPFSSVFQITKWIAGWFGFYLFYLLIIRIFYYVINKKSGIFDFKIIKRKPFLFTFIFMMVCWAPHLIIKYPAGIGWDASWQLSQGLGDTVMTTHHPVFHTMILTWFTKFGMLFGSANVGIFLFVLIQTIIGALIVAYILSVLSHINSTPWTVFFALIFFAFNPYVTIFVGQTIKDVLYMHFYLLFVFLTALYIWNDKKFWTKKNTAFLIISAAFTGTVRNNGIYIVIVVCVVLIIRELIRRRKKFYIHVAVFAASVFLPIAVTYGFNTVYQPQKGSVAESLSIPIQQTARYAKFYEDATEEEKKAIGRVLPYDEIGKLYDPYISDPVKGRYNADAGSEELKTYLKAWWEQGLRHPRCYLDATVQQNILMFVPDYMNKGYYVSVTNDAYEWKEDYFKSPDWIKDLQPIYDSVMDAICKTPVLFLLNNNVIYIIAGLLLFLSFCTRKIKGRHYIFLPLFISFLVILAGPCSCYHVRYTFPIVYCVPLFLALYTAFNNRLREEDR